MPNVPTAVAPTMGVDPNMMKAIQDALSGKKKDNLEVPQKNTSTDQLSFSELKVKGDICPTCGVGAMVYQEGCSKCYACGHSEC